MSTLMFRSLILFISFFQAPALQQTTVSLSTTIIIYETAYPLVTVYINDSGCPTIPWCNQLTSNTLLQSTISDTLTASISLANNLNVMGSSANTSGGTQPSDTSSADFQITSIEENINLNTNLETSESNTSSWILNSSSIISSDTTSPPISINSFDSDTTSNTPITSTITSSSTPNLSPGAFLHPTSRPPFLLKRQGSDDFVQYGPEGSIILGPVMPLQVRSPPANFILHRHGYLTCGNDLADIVFLRQAKYSDANSYSESLNMFYYNVRHGPKNEIFTHDLTSEFFLESGVLGFTREGFNGSIFGWYVDGADTTVPQLYMAPVESPVPDTFSEISLAKQNVGQISVGDEVDLFTTTDTDTDTSITTDAITYSEPETTHMTHDLTSETPKDEELKPTEACGQTPDPSLVWDLVNWIHDFKLQDYCSSLLGLDGSIATAGEDEALTEPSSTVTITASEIQTETSTTFTETVTVAASTVYDASKNNKILEKRQDEDDTSTTLAAEAPPVLAPFCAVDISAACSDAIAFSSVIFPQPEAAPVVEDAPIITVFETVGNTTTEIISTATTTTLANITEITYDGTGLLVPDAGTYRLWFLYWTGEFSDPSLYLRRISSQAAIFTAEYRPILDAYRMYTTSPDGTNFYMSIIVPVGISSIKDYTISLKTLNDINSDENSVLLYVDFNWDSGYISVNTGVTGAGRGTMYGCPVSKEGQMRTQVRLYALSDGTVPRDCQAWSNLMFAS
ncbi:hypothetical protein H072_8121 [Dactylellina haptotyla CBS 200.50]|uniref:GLEYA adhesin domain-containing protein n=1 Tax=Dactylellina haptotyla (strain CBS 200.50) TaxID=1284197 RepID=S8A5P3_DACHA|nr:hypothetical protein H072_8121 [Dactylellina haptotyla CBS 200.50]